MTREEIREGIAKRLFQIEEGVEVTDEWWAEMCDRDWSNAIVSSEGADIILNYLHSQGVVIKVGEELPDDLFYNTYYPVEKAKYAAFEPLIEDGHNDH